MVVIWWGEGKLNIFTNSLYTPIFIYANSHKQPYQAKMKIKRIGPRRQRPTDSDDSKIIDRKFAVGRFLEQVFWRFVFVLFCFDFVFVLLCISISSL